MDSLRLSNLSNLLKFPAHPDSIVKDASVLNCGCLVSESQFIQLETKECPVCLANPVSILKEIQPLRELYAIVQQIENDSSSRIRRVLSLRQRNSKTTIEFKPQSTDDMDLLGLFCKIAKEDAAEAQSALADTRSLSLKIPAVKGAYSYSPTDQPIQSLSQNLDIPSTQQAALSNLAHKYNLEHNLLLGLSEQEEYNFSQCFPFHRNVTTFATQQTKFSFSSSALKLKKFLCTAVFTTFDPVANREIAYFALVSDKRWELYKYVTTKPQLLACGKLSGEYGPNHGDMKAPKSEGIVVKNDFGGAKVDNVEGDDLSDRLKSWIHLYCCLSEKYLILSGTKGLVRVLNVDASVGPIGQPVYSYLTNFPIRCISLSPNDKLVACGITAREKISGKQQPFIILHQIETDKSGLTSVTPITITVPYRDPLKIINFNASSTHLLCCTVYEMRYFIIRLRGEEGSDYRRPRLIFSDMRVARKSKKRDSGEDGYTDLDVVFNDEDDDQMLDNEGITDIKFGRPYTNTMIITTSSMKNRPTIMLKLNGPAIDSRKTVSGDGTSEDLMFEFSSQASQQDEDTNANTNIVDADVIMKIPEIGSTIYGVDLSPRGDGMVFVDKLGRVLLVSTTGTEQLNMINLSSVRKSVVQLGEVTPALRSTEAASVKFSAHGGKIFAVDRKGLFQVFDFTKGIPGEHPGVFKCKIISV